MGTLVVSIGLVLVLGLLAGPAPTHPLAEAPPPAETPEATAREGPSEETEDLRAQVQALTEELEALREQVAGLAAQVASTRPALHTYRPPDRITFAGETVPIDRWDVAERLEREFYLSLGDPAQVVLWLKRSARYFPYIEGELGATGLPDDLKYVAVIESDLRPRAYSYARASGIWQFIPSTAQRYGLRVTSDWDERRDPARSTAAAIGYLKDLYRQFQDWPLALAGYNHGENGVEAARKRQGVATYYQLDLPAETERYFFRALAAKLILEDPGRYGFEVPPEERYSPQTTEVVTLRVVGYLRIRELAGAAGSFYREIKTLNPAIMGEVLPAGRYDVRIPKGRSAHFFATLPSLERTMEARAVRRVQYRVKSGDTLADIARRFRVSVDALKKWNAAARKPHIYPGDILTIELAGRPAPDS
jgi:soluble lytic murein transglycosylase-like protein